MILYIIRFSLCIAAFFVFYKLFMEKEKAYKFNRFFLLFGLVTSFLVPLFTINTHTEINNVIIKAQPYVPINSYYWEFYYGALLYFIILAVLLIRFTIHIYAFSHKIKAHEKINYYNSTVVLINESTSPYTFLNYIFINIEEFKKIPKELMTHELTHVQQKHSLDILLIELVKTIFWFNPILIFYKRAIQLNHEFLADNRVLENQNNLKSYQTLLLGYIGNDQSINMASSLNFSLTKKRFIMMSKTKSRVQFLKKLLVIPVFTAILLACSAKGGVTGKEMLYYWRHTANMEEVLRTGTMNEDDLKDGAILPIETEAQFYKLKDIYKKMNSTQKKSVYQLPSAPIPIDLSYSESSTSE